LEVEPTASINESNLQGREFKQKKNRNRKGTYQKRFRKLQNTLLGRTKPGNDRKKRFQETPSYSTRVRSPSEFATCGVLVTRDDDAAADNAPGRLNIPLSLCGLWR
jgi:uncharacterized GH25 family protein